MKKTISLTILFGFTIFIQPACTMKKDQAEIYTLGTWIVKPGLEEQFVEAWTSFARWTKEEYAGAGQAYLLRDKNDPLKFISYGPWDDEATILNWREREEFKRFMGRARELCDEFHPSTFILTSTSN